MRVLVTGGLGQLGHALTRAAWGPSTDLIVTDRRVCNMASPESIRDAVLGAKPDLVVNAAAYTAVDRAESEKDLAARINTEAPGVLADACAETGAALLHVSTDYVFDGRKQTPYREDDKVNPLGTYGRTKAAGERLVRERLDRAIILRTSWVFSATGQNFVKTILRLAGTGRDLRIVADQQGGPTDADDLAAAIVAIAGRIEADSAVWGVFHFSGSPATTWHGFAEAIIAAALPAGARPKVVAIETAQYPTPAPRPANSILDGTRLEECYGIASPDWRIGLARVVAKLAADAQPENRK
jgi:dTDP-4-dehydrorhamnose reductase